jgi:hypothetical protein
MKKLSTIFLILLLFSNSAFSQTQLSFRFSNPLFIEGSPQLFQFDVDVKANETGTFLRDLQVYFDYNPWAFGDSIVTNGKVTVTSLDLMQNHYQVVNQADNTSSKFAVIIDATEEMNHSGSVENFNEMPISFTGLLRFQVEIADANETTGISFYQVLMNGGQYRQSTSFIEPVVYLNPNIYENSLSNLSLKGHEIDLPSGWTGISSYLNPFESDVENLFDPIINELILLQNFTGFYFPGENVNTLGNWNRTYGYMIKVNNNCQLKIVGNEINDKTLILTAGWNLIPVLSACQANTTSIFADVLSNVIIVKEVAGIGIFWPEQGINSISTLKPGKAYFVKMATSGSISFPNCDD